MLQEHISPRTWKLKIMTFLLFCSSFFWYFTHYYWIKSNYNFFTITSFRPCCHICFCSKGTHGLQTTNLWSNSSGLMDAYGYNIHGILIEQWETLRACGFCFYPLTCFSPSEWLHLLKCNFLGGCRMGRYQEAQRMGKYNWQLRVLSGFSFWSPCLSTQYSLDKIHYQA